jgi:hypothetical protein
MKLPSRLARVVAATTLVVGPTLLRRARRTDSLAPQPPPRPAGAAERSGTALDVASPAHAPPGRPRDRLNGDPSRMRAWIESVPLGTRLACVGVTLTLVVVPALLSVARASEFRAGVQVFPLNTQAGFPLPASDVAYVRSLAASPLVDEETVARAGEELEPGTLAERTVIQRTEQSVLVSVSAETPDRARRLAQALSVALASASARALGARAQERLESARARLAAASVDAPDRPELARQVAELERLARTPPPQLAFGPPPTAPRPARTVDRAIDALPGPFPPNPGAAWAATAGLLVALLVCALGLFYRARRAQSSVTARS